MHMNMKYYWGNMKTVILEIMTTFMFCKWPFHQHSFNSLQLSVFQFLFLEKDIVTPTIKADNVSPFVLFNQKPYQLPVKLLQHKSIKWKILEAHIQYAKFRNEKQCCLCSFLGNRWSECSHGRIGEYLSYSCSIRRQSCSIHEHQESSYWGKSFRGWFDMLL